MPVNQLQVNYRPIKMLLKFLIMGFVATAIGQNIDATIDDVFGTSPPNAAAVPNVAIAPSGGSGDVRVGDEKVRKFN